MHCTLLLIVLSATLMLVHSAPLPELTSNGRRPSPQCDPEEWVCSECYDVLANEVVISDMNRYNLQNAFFPPTDSSPVFVVVTYHFIRNSSGPTDYSMDGPTQTWFWTQSTFYLFQPIESLEFTSLFFSDTTRDSGVTVDLYLQPSCENSSTDRMQLLTQRLKAYAAQQSIAPSLTEDYDAKGESFDTLKVFHSEAGEFGGKHLSNYIFALQVFLPIFAAIFLGGILYHLIENKKLHFLRFPAKENDHEDSHELENIKLSTVNMSIYAMISCSYVFVVYVFILDCMAVHYRRNVISEIFHTVEISEKNLSKLRLEYGIPGLMLGQDLVVLVLMIFLSVKKLNIYCYCPKEKEHQPEDEICCKCCNCSPSFRKKGPLGQLKWYNIIAGPLFCIIIHSYHILIGFIHSPHHATSILVFYAIVIFTFIITLKATYYNLFKLYATWTSKKQCEEGCIECLWFTLCWCRCTHTKDENTKTGDGKNDKTGTKDENAKTGDGEHNNKRERERGDKEDGCCHGIVIFLLLAVSLFIGLFFVYLVCLFILLPINNVIDDAPDRILNINHTILILFGAAITYKLYQHKKFDSLLDHLVQAANEQNKTKSQPTQHITQVRDWEQNTRNEKRKEIASALLTAIYKQADIQEPGQLAPV